MNFALAAIGLLYGVLFIVKGLRWLLAAALSRPIVRSDDMELGVTAGSTRGLLSEN